VSSGAVIDSSVLVAVLIGEPEAGVILDVLSGLEQCRISAVNVLEASTVMASRRGSGGVAGLQSLFDVFDIEVAPFTADHAALALDAWRAYGKGRHPARLNLGDCCAYALAKYSGRPLLAKGDDFAQTDIELVALRAYRDVSTGASVRADLAG